jgi:hypothetical protein
MFILHLPAFVPLIPLDFFTPPEWLTMTLLFVSATLLWSLVVRAAIALRK